MYENLINTLKMVCGKAPELTIRAERSFTFSFDTVEREAANKLSLFFEDYVVSVAHDEEIGTFVYVDAA